MRISSALAPLAVIGFAAGFAPLALAFDGTRTPATQMTAVEAFRNGTRALMQGKTDQALSSLQYAAENGHPLAQWKLGYMYSKGDGVPQNDLRAFKYFSRVADSHADDRPDTPEARVVANAFVALGHYYLHGIPHSEIHANPERAREMYHYAATYFADPDAQYGLARMCLDGVGGPRDPRRAIRWLALASHKGQYQAQALLGAELFKGEHVRRQASRGLMWLTLARDAAHPSDTWIIKLYDAAFKQASDDERAMALIYLERWLKSRRE